MQNDEIKQIFRDIVADGCLTYTESRDLTCFYCGGSVNYTMHGPDTVNHEKTCVFVRVQQKLTQTETQT